MRQALAAFVVCMAIGCGGSSDGGAPDNGGTGGSAVTTGTGGSAPGAGGGGAAPSIVGNWIASANASCDVYLDISATEFVLGDACVAADGSIETSATKGTYTYDAAAAGTNFITSNTSATCSDTPSAYGETVSLSGNDLVMGDSSGAVSFVRNSASGSGVITYGCFSNGTFTAAPLAPL